MNVTDNYLKEKKSVLFEQHYDAKASGASDLHSPLKLLKIPSDAVGFLLSNCCDTKTSLFQLLTQLDFIGLPQII